MLRFSYHELLVKAVPLEFHKFVPPPATTHFMFTNDSVKHFDDANQLIALFKLKKKSPEIFSEFFEKKKFDVETQLELLTHCFLELYSKTMSHLSNSMQLYIQLFKLVITDLEKKSSFYFKWRNVLWINKLSKFDHFS